MEFTSKRFDPEHLLTLLMENSPIGITLLTTDFRYIAVSRMAAERFLQLPMEEAIGRYCYDVMGMYRNDPNRAGRERVCEGCSLARSLSTGNKTTHIRQMRPGVIAHITSVPLTDDHGDVVGIMELIEDISDKVTDPLTRIHNYRFYHEMLAIETSRAERYEEPLALLALDLNDFKRVNDMYGHVHGDMVLVRAADAIRSAVRESDHLCRIGGDEFAVLAPHTDKEQAEVLGDRIRSVVRRELRSYDISISCGVAAYPEDTDDPVELREIADRQMYRAKDARAQRPSPMV